MRRAIPLSVQLLLTFVGLIVGMAAVLTGAAYTSLRANLESEASRHVADATRLREERLTHLFEGRQQRAEGFLRSVESLCAEPLDSGRLAWADDCVRPMVEDLRKTERALGVLLSYRQRRLHRAGQRITTTLVSSPALATVVRARDGSTEYATQASRRDTVVTLQFDDEEVVTLFDGGSDMVRGGTVFLVDGKGTFIAPHVQASGAPQNIAGHLAHCQMDRGSFVDVDYRGIKSFQSFRALRVLANVCVGAVLGYNDAVAPAERLRAHLMQHGAWFALIGVVLSLVAAQWISAPVRRLAQSARKLQAGRFERPLPVGGPSEVRALGTAFNAMSNDLAELLAREQAARREAEDSSRAKDEFLATVSHELRTPLTAVLGWAHMLQGDDVPADRLRHGLSVIERSARAQTQLIDDLLDVSRIVSNRLRVAREPVQLGEIVESALDALRPQAVAKQIELRAGDLSEPALVLGDPHRLEQVVWNLLWNAIKFTQPSGRITVELRRDEQGLSLRVSDTGVGISSSFLPYVFEWFRQEDARSRSQAGLGLGLGIVRHIIQLHGGSVRAESRGLGQGATFIVTLPIHTPATVEIPVARRVQDGPRPVHRLDAARVLVVEDDADARELVKATLERAGASVETVGNTQDARREVLADAPDVLISDIRMPEEDGYELLRSLREAGVDTPAIALTAYARREDADEARAAGYQIHLAKPVDAARLVDAVATLLRDRNVH
jgi:signal transduction histidine kinase/ActR/RegA family two-component response regulator